MSNPFQPTSTEPSPASPALSARPVSLPHLPELYLPNFLDVILPPSPNAPSSAAKAPATADNGFMSGLREIANRSLTENNAAAYASTTHPGLDAFTALNQATDNTDFEPLLRKSWGHDPLITLKIIWNLRSIHQGKSAREPFYRAFAWLLKNHPRTAIGNLSQLVEPVIEPPALKAPEKETEAKGDKPAPRGMSHGYYKDLLNILALASVDQLSETATFNALHVPRTEKTHKRRGSKKSSASSDPKTHLEASLKKDQYASNAAADIRREKAKSIHSALLDKLAHDKPFLALFIAVARIFAEALKKDLELLRRVANEDISANERFELSFKISLAGKWAPSPGASHDRATSICTAISLLLCHSGALESITFPKSPQVEASSQEFALKLRGVYTRWVTSPLRRFMEIPEVRMSANQWDKIIYSRTPSICMSKNKQFFFKHDKERFAQYIRDVASGKKTISGATLLPNQVLVEALKLDSHSSKKGAAAEIERISNENSIMVLEQQWKTLVKSVKDAGVLENSIAVCDVSGSMGSLGGHPDSPINAAVALSIILAQVSSAPWSNSFITFSASPEIVTFDGDAGLASIARALGSSSWGMNTNFNAVFTKLILPMAIKHNLKREDMIKRLFVFSDMEFDDSRREYSSTVTGWETEHSVIKKQFEKAGYDLPEIVYWNLQGNGSKPVTSNEEGVAIVSGFSHAMLKVFLDEGDVSIGEEWEEVIGETGETKKVKKALDPVDTMNAALGKPSYSGLVLLD